MKKFILLALTLCSLSSFAQSLPWPDSMLCARHLGLNNNGKLVDNSTQYNWYAVAWKDVITDMGTLLNKPNLKLSFDYIQYRTGYQLMKEVDYATDCNSFEEVDTEVKELFELQKTRPLTKEDFKTPRWIHMVNPLDTEEVNCLAMSKKNGKLFGCGDLWQDGISEDEAVCIKGKTYLRCHVSCMEKIYNRQIELEPGFCK